MKLLDRMKGSLLGLAVGDAVGTTNEFKVRGTFEPITDMVGGGPFHLNPGEWTDDTSMALCLAQSLIDCKGFDARDQLLKYLNWYHNGYMSSIGSCFDIGGQTSAVLQYFDKTLDEITAGYASRRSDGSLSSGNGSLMRLAPIPIVYYPNRQLVHKYAVASSLTTHPSHICLDACSTYAQLICDAFDGKDKRAIISNPLLYKVKAHNIGMDIEDVKASGYVLDSIAAAVWCFARTESFEEAILLAANLGDDADTTAAICGQLAGAFYGMSGIPQHWLDRVYNGDFIEELAFDLSRLSYNEDFK